MKIARITTFYQKYVTRFYDKHPGLALKGFTEQKAALDYDAFGWADCWSHALAPFGYDVLNIYMNVDSLQRAWARENDVKSYEEVELRQVCLEQVKKFQPDILWFDDYDTELLRTIRQEVDSIQLVLGWTGSAIGKTDIWSHMDLVLSCAPERVAWFKNQGIASVHLNHGFDQRINGRLQQCPKNIDISFVGHLLRGSDYHLNREQLLEQLSVKTDLQIYSPSADFCWKDDVKSFLKIGVYNVTRVLQRVGMPVPVLRSLPILGTVFQWTQKPVYPVNQNLKPYIKPAVFGLDMYQVLKNSRITLNIHADSSPLFASNMRLFEATGIATCMITDWKQNLSDFFEVDKEVVAYKSLDECVDKIQWLLNNPKKCEEIAQSGNARVLREHTYECRAQQLVSIINQALPCNMRTSASR